MTKEQIKHKVYKSKEDNPWFFSDCVKREFGQNKIIRLNDGTSVVSAVQPLHDKSELIVCGFILENIDD